MDFAPTRRYFIIQRHEAYGQFRIVLDWPIGNAKGPLDRLCDFVSQLSNDLIGPKSCPSQDQFLGLDTAPPLLQQRAGKVPNTRYLRPPILFAHTTTCLSFENKRSAKSCQTTAIRVSPELACTSALRSVRLNAFHPNRTIHKTRTYINSRPAQIATVTRSNTGWKSAGLRRYAATEAIVRDAGPVIAAEPSGSVGKSVGKNALRLFHPIQAAPSRKHWTETCDGVLNS